MGETVIPLPEKRFQAMSDPFPPLPARPFDVRMRGFPRRTAVAAAQQLLFERLAALTAETVPLPDATGRILAADVAAAVAVPAFARAAMDGYALIAAETAAAEPGKPLELAVLGQSLPARPFTGAVQTGQTVRIMTGAPVPAGADAVLPAEVAAEVEQHGEIRLQVSAPVPPGKNIGKIGEDIQPGDTVLRAGRALRPQDLGVLASIGAAPVPVIRRPTVAILATGDELLPCGSRPAGYHIVDSNSVMLQALVQRDGGQCSPARLLPDRSELIRSALADATEDVILLSGGSSVGVEDHAPRVLAELGELPVHGVALRPAGPTGIGFVQGRPVFLLPGNPVACLCAYDLFAGLAVRRLGGRPADLPYRQTTLPLAHKITSAPGEWITCACR